MDLIEAPVSMVVVDDARFPDRDTSAVFEHLVRYLAHSDELPAIQVRLEAGRLVLSARGKYLRAAQRLGRDRIGMHVVGATPEDFARLVGRPGVTKLDWAQIDRAQRARPEGGQWHVRYFDGALNQQAADRFRAEVVDRIFTAAGGATRFTVDLDAGLVEFLARTPHENRGRASRLLAALRAFSSDVAEIASYQGTRFSTP